MMASFTESIGGLLELTVGTGELWEPLFITNQAMVLGYLLAIVTAIPLGLAAGRSKTLDRMADPYVAIFNAVPIAPLIPIVLVALGLGLASRVLIVYFFAFVFISVNTRAGVRKVDRSLTEMATSFGANESEVWRLVVIPGSLPSIFAGLRIGLGRAIAGMVIVELLLVASGIGRILLRASGRLEGDLVFGLVLVIVLESLILLALMRGVERRMTPWAHDASV
jgi:NitT/TauT family transport system permease protein